jgi:hypothetical protein
LVLFSVVVVVVVVAAAVVVVIGFENGERNRSFISVDNGGAE